MLRIDRDAPDHRWTFKRNTPPVHMNVLRETHGLEHLRTKHAAVPDLDPLVQHRMERENLKGRLQEVKKKRVDDAGQDRCPV